MAYQAWSVVFGEQPSASKWNILGTNDAGFNDGTAIGDDAIITRHILASAITAAELASGAVTPSKLDLDPATAVVTTSQSTASNSYTDLATAGPAVTLTIGANALALVILFCQSSSATDTQNNYMGFAVSGASTIAVDDSRACEVRISDATAAGFHHIAATFLLTASDGLTAGSNTFTAKYRTNANAGFFANRKITVIPL